MKRSLTDTISPRPEKMTLRGDNQPQHRPRPGQHEAALNEFVTSVIVPALVDRWLTQRSTPLVKASKKDSHPPRESP